MATPSSAAGTKAPVAASSSNSSSGGEDVDEKLLEAARRQNERDAKLCDFLGKGDTRGLNLVGGSVSDTTFHEAVKENMDIFGVSKEQAVKDVTQEFRLLGIDVSELAAKAVLEEEQ
jgi:hypothetical protein